MPASFSFFCLSSSFADTIILRTHTRTYNVLANRVRTPRDTERHRESQRDTERHRETQRDTNRERERERERESLPWCFN